MLTFGWTPTEMVPIWISVFVLYWLILLQGNPWTLKRMIVTRLPFHYVFENIFSDIFDTIYMKNWFFFLLVRRQPKWLWDAFLFALYWLTPLQGNPWIHWREWLLGGYIRPMCLKTAFLTFLVFLIWKILFFAGWAPTEMVSKCYSVFALYWLAPFLPVIKALVRKLPKISGRVFWQSCGCNKIGRGTYS